jgi:hypothetical protein
MVSDVLDAGAALGHCKRLGAMITVLSGPDSGSAVVMDRRSGMTAGQGKGWLTADVRSDADHLMDREESQALVYGDRRAETAISILAEMIQVRYGVGTGSSLRGSELAIHVD